MERVRHVRVKSGMRVDELVQEFGRAGVFSAGRLAKAAEIYVKMVESRCKIFLGVAGALTAGGLRGALAQTILSGLAHVVVATGANVTHDLIEALGGYHLRGKPSSNDVKLRELGLSRVYDVYVPTDAFKRFEDGFQALLRQIPGGRMSSASMLREVGLRLEDEGSFVRAAARQGVPLFSPGLADSIAGLHAWLVSQDKELVLDSLLDLREMVELSSRAKEAGAVFLGGGMPKNFIFQSRLLAGPPFKHVIQITMDRPEHGGLSGATLEEAKSWGKVAPDAQLVTVIGDATVLFPLLLAAVLGRLSK